jgi:DNA-binding transcriptional LysR family regulator
VLPRHLVASTGIMSALITKELPFSLPKVHVDMLWHERDTRSPAHKWLRSQFTEVTNAAFAKRGMQKASG